MKIIYISYYAAHIIKIIYSCFYAAHIIKIIYSCYYAAHIIKIIYNCYYTAHINKIFKSRKTRLMQPVACMAEKGTAYKFCSKIGGEETTSGTRALINV